MMLETDTLGPALDNDNDLVITGGQLQFASGMDAVTQLARANLETFRGEWFLDIDAGLPYYQEILVKNPNIPRLRVLLRDAVLAVPGVTEVASIKLTYTAATRNMAVEIQAKVEFSDTPATIVTEI